MPDSQTANLLSLACQSSSLAWQPGSLPVSLLQCQSINLTEVSLQYCQPSRLHIYLSDNQGLCQSAYKSVSPLACQQSACSTANLPTYMLTCLATRVSASQLTSLSIHNLAEVSLQYTANLPACMLTCLATRVSASQPTSQSVHNLPEVSLQCSTANLPAYMLTCWSFRTIYGG